MGEEENVFAAAAAEAGDLEFKGSALLLRANVDGRQALFTQFLGDPLFRIGIEHASAHFAIGGDSPEVE